MRKPTLGRGLADLLGQSRAVPGVTLRRRCRPRPRARSSPSCRSICCSAAATSRASTCAPRRSTELADSIKAQGVVQPIVVRPLDGPGDGKSQRYEIIAGERRWRAAQMAGLREIPAVIRHVPDEAAIAMALIENIQRENLNPLEEARALERLISEFGLTHQQAAEAVGRSRAGVSNLLRLLELAPEVCELLEQRQLEMGHARALLALEQRRKQVEVATLVAKKGLSVRETEALVRRLQAPAAGRWVRGAPFDARSERRAPRAGPRREARRPGRDPAGQRRQGQARGHLQQPGRARRDPRAHSVAAGLWTLYNPPAFLAGTVLSD